MNAKGDEQSGSVKSVEVAVQILDALTEATGPVRVTDLARDLGMTKARVSRHLQTLSMLKLVERAPAGSGYVFGRKLMKYGRAAVYRSNIVELAQPYLRRMRDETGHTAVQTLPTRDGSLVVAAMPNEFEPGVAIRLGTLLAFPQSPSARLGRFFEGSRFASAVLEANLVRFGLDFEVDVHGNGLGGIAAPIFEADGSLATTVGLVLSSALVDPEPAAVLIAQVSSAAAAIQARYAEGATSPLMPVA